MTFAAAGSPVAFSAATFSLTPVATGDFVLCEVVCESATVSATALSSSNVSWSVLTGPTTTPADGFLVTVFIGRVTSASTATVTVTFSGVTPTVRANAQEFSTTAGFGLVTLDTVAVTGAGSGTAYPSITPGHGAGELYYCYAFNQGIASAGATSGYTYFVDPNNNGMCYNAACGAGAQAPVWADTSIRDGIAVMLYEAAAGSGRRMNPYGWIRTGFDQNQGMLGSEGVSGA